MAPRDPVLAKNPLPTPIDWQLLDASLEGYDSDLRTFLVDGFRYGFRIKFDGASDCRAVKNSVIAQNNPVVLDQFVQKEMSLNRLYGPYNTLPFVQCHVSPVSLREKSDKGQYRMIHDLSYPYDGKSSVNDGISFLDATVQYASVQDAITVVKQLGVGTVMAKADIKSAFRLIPIHPECYHLFCFKVGGLFYIDRCLQMGCAMACQIFEKFSTALEWVLRVKYGVKFVNHYLDDFIFFSETHQGRQLALLSFQRFAQKIGLPLAPEKTLGPARVLVFLGIQLDSLHMKATLPESKVKQYAEEIEQFLQLSVSTLHQFQAIVGRLQWANTVVLPGRAFLRRLIDGTKGRLSRDTRICITDGMKSDLRLWADFLSSHNGVSFFLSEQKLHSPELHLFTDASFQAGAGYMGDRWFVVQYPEAWHRYGITFLELYPIVLAVYLFGDRFRNKRLVFHTDNEACVYIINKQTSRSPRIMRLVRQLVLCTLRRNTKFSAIHVPGIQNSKADALSRLQVTPGQLKQWGMRKNPEVIPREFKPQNWRGR